MCSALFSPNMNGLSLTWILPGTLVGCLALVARDNLVVAVPLLWLGGSYVHVGVCYARNLPRGLGKLRDGSMHPAAILYLLPYLLLARGVWHLLRLVDKARHRPTWSEITPRLLVGRRLTASETPPEEVLVLDLTCEFPEPSPLQGERYLSFPILDGYTPTDEALVSLVRKLAPYEGKVFVHCAQGSGRTGLVAACLLLTRGNVGSPDEALGLLQAKRPWMRLSTSQKEQLHRVGPRLCGSSI